MLDEEHITHQTIGKKLTDKSERWINSDGKDCRLRWRGKRLTPIILRGDPLRSVGEIEEKLEKVDDFLDELESK